MNSISLIVNSEYYDKNMNKIFLLAMKKWFRYLNCGMINISRVNQAI